MNTSSNTTARKASDLTPLRNAALNLMERINEVRSQFSQLHARIPQDLALERNHAEDDLTYLGRLSMHLATIEASLVSAELIGHVREDLSGIRPTAEAEAPTLRTNRPTTKLGRFFNRAAELVG